MEKKKDGRGRTVKGGILEMARDGNRERTVDKGGGSPSLGEVREVWGMIWEPYFSQTDEKSLSS